MYFVINKKTGNFASSFISHNDVAGYSWWRHTIMWSNHRSWDLSI